MRKLSYLFALLVLISGGILIGFSPDVLSLLIVGIMEAVILLGIVFGVLPVISYGDGFRSGMRSIDRVASAQSGSVLPVLMQIEHFFRQKTLDELFAEYCEKLNGQHESGQVLGDIEESINEDVLGLHSWQSVILQIPGTLTGLGILGTFVGLLLGIGDITFASVSAALSSINTLINGIKLAFYTSIAGVILSILFNILYRVSWNLMLRDLGMFTEAFHKAVIPTTEEQQRYREQRELGQITGLLGRLPRAASYSVARGGGESVDPAGNEQVLMPQILAGLRNGEFIFCLQPRYDLAARRIVGAEALVRWNHPRLGMLSPAVFLPILERNGSITRLDRYIWEAVCRTIREWIDEGVRPVPISVNVTKTDVMAMDVDEALLSLIKQYRIPPRNIEIEIAQNAYLQAQESTSHTEEKLRQNGFRVVVDGFEGDILALQSGSGFRADALKLDLRAFAGKQPGAVTAVLEQARRLNISVSAVGIETMEQLSLLRRNGCIEGQGYFFSRPVSVQAFPAMLKGEDQ